MCYGIKDLVGKKTREAAQRPGSPESERVGHSVQTVVQGWLTKLGHKKAAREQKERKLEVV